MNLSKKEEDIFRKLDNPSKIQDFINKLGINFEEKGETCMSPRMVLKTQKCHCIEAAFLAAAIFWFHGKKPLVIDMRATKSDFDHVITVFMDKKNKKWGAISKSNHAVLRYREPIYRDIRELVMSYFHEYTDEKGNKTLREYSSPIDLSLFGSDWVTSEENLWHINDSLDKFRHIKILSKKQARSLRKQDKIEMKLNDIVECARKKKA